MLTILALLLGTSCACTGVVAWLGVKLVIYLLGLLLGLILPPQPEFLELQELELVEIVLEDPPEATEEDVPDYQEYLAAQEAEAAAEELALARTYAMDAAIAESAGLLAFLGTTGDDAWGDEVVGIFASGSLDSDLGGIGGLIGAKGVAIGSGGLGSRGSGLGGGGTAEGLGGLGTKGVGGATGYGRGAGNVDRGEARVLDAGSGPSLVHLPEPRLPQAAEGLGVDRCTAEVVVDERGRADGDPTWVRCPVALRHDAEKALKRARWSWPSSPGRETLTVTVWFRE